MAKDAIVFAMANPTPEVQPEDGLERRRDHGHRPLATTRTRSTTCWPSRASSAARSTCARAGIDEAMKLAAARAIAGVIPESDLGPEYIVPSVFNRAVAPAVADAVAAAAIESGIARRDRASRQAEVPAP